MWWCVRVQFSFLIPPTPSLRRFSFAFFPSLIRVRGITFSYYLLINNSWYSCFEAHFSSTEVSYWTRSQLQRECCVRSTTSTPFASIRCVNCNQTRVTDNQNQQQIKTQSENETQTTKHIQQLKEKNAHWNDLTLMRVHRIHRFYVIPSCRTSPNHKLSRPTSPVCIRRVQANHLQINIDFALVCTRLIRFYLLSH